jgi:hypothetical protein
MRHLRSYWFSPQGITKTGGACERQFGRAETRIETLEQKLPALNPEFGSLLPMMTKNWPELEFLKPLNDSNPS